MPLFSEEGKLVVESLQVVIFVEGMDLVASMSDREGGLPHLGKEQDGSSNSEFVAKGVTSGRILCSSSKAPSSPHDGTYD